MQPIEIEAQPKTVEDLFGGVSLIKYRIPIYQRHYIWTPDNWKHLWDDIQDLDKKINGKNTSEEEVMPHFAGVIVVRNDEETKEREIVDGQQRLTTFQIIFCAIRDVFGDVNNRANEFMLNSSGIEDNQFKLLPRAESDKEVFKLLVDRQVIKNNGLIKDAYVYFKSEIQDYMNENGPEKLIELFNVFSKGFYVHEIEVKSSRSAAKIFESINGRGQPLAQFDHLRNNLFLRAGNAGRTRNYLYRNYWEHFNTIDFWRDNEVLNTFLKSFLQAKLGLSTINESSLFDLYQQEYHKLLQENLKIDEVDQTLMTDFLQGELGHDFESELSTKDTYLIVHEFKFLKEYSLFYQNIAFSEPNTSLGFYKFLETSFGITCWHPLVLLLKCEQEDLGISNDNLKSILEVLEAYIVSSILWQGPKVFRGENNQERLVGEIISKIRKKGINNGTGLMEYLKNLPYKIKWPNVRMVKSALRNAGEKNASIVQYILFKIECSMRPDPDYTENEFTNFDDLNREHVMPINWRNVVGWKEETDQKKIQERSEWLHSIGNLTLLNKKVNAEKVRDLTFSGNKETSKRARYIKYSQLKITDYIKWEDKNQTKARRSWDVNEIKYRHGIMLSKFHAVFDKSSHQRHRRS